MFVGIGEESDNSGECVSEIADRRGDGESIIGRATKDLGMDVMGDNGGVGDVDWDHSFPDGSIKHDLSRFGVAKDVELCTSAK